MEPKVYASCWTCDQEYDVSRWGMKYGVQCDAPGCDGYVISLSGRIKFRIAGDFSSSPLQPVMRLESGGSET